MDDQEIELSRVHLTIGLLPYYFESATKAAIVSSVVLNKETGRGTIRFRFHDTVILYADTSLGCCEYVVQILSSGPGCILCFPCYSNMMVDMLTRGRLIARHLPDFT